MSRARVVHYTQHLCVLEGHRPDAFEFCVAFKARFPALSAYTIPDVSGCHYAEHPAGAGARFSLDWDKVTCRRCRTTRSGAPRAPGAPLDTARAYIVCCNKLGVQWSLPSKPLEQIDADDREERRKKQLERISDLWGLVPFSAEQARRIIESTVAECDDDIRQRYAPMIAEFTLITDWLGAIDECKRRALAATGEEIDEDYAAAQGAILHFRLKQNERAKAVGVLA